MGQCVMSSSMFNRRTVGVYLQELIVEYKYVLFILVRHPNVRYKLSIHIQLSVQDTALKSVTMKPRIVIDRILASSIPSEGYTGRCFSQNIFG